MRLSFWTLAILLILPTLAVGAPSPADQPCPPSFASPPPPGATRFESGSGEWIAFTVRFPAGGLGGIMYGAGVHTDPLGRSRERNIALRVVESVDGRPTIIERFTGPTSRDLGALPDSGGTAALDAQMISVETAGADPFCRGGGTGQTLRDCAFYPPDCVLPNDYRIILMYASETPNLAAAWVWGDLEILAVERGVARLVDEAPFACALKLRAQVAGITNIRMQNCVASWNIDGRAYYHVGIGAIPDEEHAATWATPATTIDPLGYTFGVGPAGSYVLNVDRYAATLGGAPSLAELDRALGFLGIIADVPPL